MYREVWCTYTMEYKNQPDFVFYIAWPSVCLFLEVEELIWATQNLTSQIEMQKEKLQKEIE